MKKLLIAFLIVTSAFAGWKGNMMPSFSDFDLNKNGEITQEEFDGMHQQRMQDRAEDGRMMRNAANSPLFSDIDADKNGLISSEELKDHQMTNRRGAGKGMGYGKGMGR